MSAETHREVRLPGTEVHRLHSDAVGDDFEISVIPPPPGVEGPFPVVYMTDANLLLGLGASALSLLVLGCEIPPVLGVGVGYPIGEDLGEYVLRRTRDFSPEADEVQQAAMANATGIEIQETGGAEAFLTFLTTELRPWVQQSYDVTPDSTIVGHSMGGLFATYTLFHQPDAFRRYVIGSPWLSWAHPLGFHYEEEFAAENDDLDAIVFLTAGADEDVLPPSLPPALAENSRKADVTAHTRRLSAALESRGYPNLRLTTRIFPGETHITIPPIMHAHGLRAVFTDERLGAEVGTSEAIWDQRE